MKNKLSDLNNHLFAQLERLSDESLTPEQIDQEVTRAAAIVDVSNQIVKNADLQLKAANLVANHGERFRDMLPAMGGDRRPPVPIAAPRGEAEA